MHTEEYNCDENAIFSKLSEVEILFNQPILDVTKTGSYVFKFKPDELDNDQLINSNEIRFKKNNTVSVRIGSGISINLKYVSFSTTENSIVLHTVALCTPYDIVDGGVNFIGWRVYKKRTSPRYVCASIKSLSDDRLCEYGSDFSFIIGKISDFVDKHKHPHSMRLSLAIPDNCWKHWWKLSFDTENNQSIYSIEQYKAWGEITIDDAEDVHTRINITYNDELKTLSVAMTEFTTNLSPIDSSTTYKMDRYDEYENNEHGVYVTAHFPTVDMFNRIAIDRCSLLFRFNDDFSFNSLDVNGYNADSLEHMISNLCRVQEVAEIVEYIKVIIKYSK